MHKKRKYIVYLCCCSLWIVFLSRSEGVWLLITVANCFKACFSPCACSISVGGFSASPLVTRGQLSSASLSSKMGLSCTQRSSTLDYKTTNGQRIKNNIDSFIVTAEMWKVDFNIESQSLLLWDPLWKKKVSFFFRHKAVLFQGTCVFFRIWLVHSTF